MRIFNLIPLLLLLVVLTVFTGWFGFGWKLTSVLPYLIVFVVLLLCSLTWRIAVNKRFGQASLILLLTTLITSVLFLSGIVAIYQVWAVFVLCGFGSVQIYLADTAARSSRLTGNLRYIPFIPMFFTVYSITGMFAWNGSLAGAWIGLLLSLFLAFFGLLTTSGKTDNA